MDSPGTAAQPAAPAPAPPAIMPAADRGALKRMGEAVRARLAGDPSVYRVPVTRAEVFAVGDFLTPAECDHLSAMIDDSARPSETYDDTTQANFRTSWSGNVDREDHFVQMIERRIDDLIGADPSHGEVFQGQRYHPGQEFRAHHDWFYTNAKYWKKEEREGRQRSWTAMAYLNNTEAGGETHFPHLGISIAPQRGALLLWNNARPDGRCNEDTLHAALPVVAGVKYVITKWYRTRAWG